MASANQLSVTSRISVSENDFIILRIRVIQV